MSIDILLEVGRYTAEARTDAAALGYWLIVRQPLVHLHVLSQGDDQRQLVHERSLTLVGSHSSFNVVGDFAAWGSIPVTVISSLVIGTVMASGRWQAQRQRDLETLDIVTWLELLARELIDWLHLVKELVGELFGKCMHRV